MYGLSVSISLLFFPFCEDKFVAGVIFVIAFNAASLSVPATLLTFILSESSPATTVYFVVAVFASEIDVMGSASVSVSPVSMVTTRFPPLRVTFSLKVKVRVISAPIPYTPLSLSDSIFVMVGLTPSTVILCDAARLLPVSEKFAIAL